MGTEQVLDNGQASNNTAQSLDKPMDATIFKMTGAVILKALQKHGVSALTDLDGPNVFLSYGPDIISLTELPDKWELKSSYTLRQSANIRPHDGSECLVSDRDYFWDEGSISFKVKRDTTTTKKRVYVVGTLGQTNSIEDIDAFVDLWLWKFMNLPDWSNATHQ